MLAESKATIAFRCANGELVQARRFEMCVLSAHLRMLLDEFGSANLDLIDASDFEAQDVQDIIVLLHAFNKVAVDTCVDKISASDGAVPECFNLSKIVWPHDLVRFAHKYEIPLILELCKFSLNKVQDVREIVAYDAISPENSDWAGPAVIDFLMRLQLEEFADFEKDGPVEGRVIPRLSPALMYRVLQRCTERLAQAP